MADTTNTNTTERFVSFHCRRCDTDGEFQGSHETLRALCCPVCGYDSHLLFLKSDLITARYVSEDAQAKAQA